MDNTMSNVNLVFQKLFLSSLEKQNEKQKKKIEFLKQEAYRYFLFKEIEKILSNGNDFILYDLIKSLSTSARNKANQCVLNIIAHDDVDYCFKKRISDYKKAAKNIQPIE